MGMFEKTPAARQGVDGYHKRPKDLITVEECVILIHHHVGMAMAAHRETELRLRMERTFRFRLRMRVARLVADLRRPRP